MNVGPRLHGGCSFCSSRYFAPVHENAHPCTVVVPARPRRDVHFCAFSAVQMHCNDIVFYRFVMRGSRARVTQAAPFPKPVSPRFSSISRHSQLQRGVASRVFRGAAVTSRLHAGSRQAERAHRSVRTAVSAAVIAETGANKVLAEYIETRREVARSHEMLSS